MDVPEVRFARSDDGLSIGYCIVPGRGQRPLVFIPDLHFHNLQLEFGDPNLSAFYQRVARSRPLVRYDRRGLGLSDRPRLQEGYEWDRHLADLDAVVDAASPGPIDIWAGWLGWGLAIDYAAEHPERVAHILLWRPWRVTTPLPLDPSTRSQSLARIREDVDLWSRGVGTTICASPPEASALYASFARANADEYPLFRTDELAEHQMRPNLDGVRCPVEILYPRRTAFPPHEEAMAAAGAQALARLLPDARLRVLDESTGLPGFGDRDLVAEIVDNFLGPEEEGQSTPAQGLQTILFTDIESSTELTQSLGDEGAHEMLRGHNAAVRKALAAHHGREVKHTGDGIMASFNSAVNALEAALAIQRALAGSEVRVRIGLNAGEPIEEQGDYFGSAVQLAARVCDWAEPGRVIVTHVVRDLCRGKGFRFEDLGAVTLKGFNGAERIFGASGRSDR